MMAAPSTPRAAALAALALAMLLLPHACARRTDREAALRLGEEQGSAGKGQCKKASYTVEFPSITIEFSIPRDSRLDGIYTTSCGESAGNPDEAVLFQCKSRNGATHYEKIAGTCKSKEQISLERTPRCPERELTATWTVDGKDILLKFTLPETSNPTGEDLAVPLSCPLGSPVADKEMQFTCAKDGSWDIKGMEAMKPCIVPEQDAVAPEQKTKQETPVEGGLPCKFEAEDVKLVGGEDGFQLLVTCTEAISDARIENFQDGRDLLIDSDDIKPGARTAVITQKTASYQGREFVLVARAGGTLGSLSTKLGGEPAVQPVPAGSLPCTLGKKDVTLTTGEPGFTVALDCKDAIHDAVLKLPGFEDKRFSGEVGPGMYSLTTQDVATFKGKTLVLHGKYDGQEGVTNSVDI